MAATWPSEVEAFESFLRMKGAICRRRAESASFGDKVAEYDAGPISVRISSDRGIWYVEIADARDEQEWSDAALIRDLLVGPRSDVLDIREQIEFVEKKWDAIVQAFDDAHRAETRARLATLRKERARRRFPGIRLDD
jgi:hypothetical protein